MTPAARLAAAIPIIDAYLAGAPAEKVLTTWARKSRFAGSKDRAAVRDIVFQCVRCRTSYALLGGSETGRGLVIGYARDQLEQPEALFDGSGYGPESLTEEEKKCFRNKAVEVEAHASSDLPDWLVPLFQASFGADFQSVAHRLKSRAPVFVRVNRKRATVETAIKSLETDQIVATPHPLATYALEITENARRIAQSKAFASGQIELQDVASQAVCETLPIRDGARILDFCAGGGGKSLALAAVGAAEVFAHDMNSARMAEIPKRAERAGVEISIIDIDKVSAYAPFDLVLCDAPCSGSGAWRRSPEGKWTLTPEKLGELTSTQLDILMTTKDFISEEGTLAYATCSVFIEENEAVVERFLNACPDWDLGFSRRFSPLEGGDGFFVAHLTRKDRVF